MACLNGIFRDCTKPCLLMNFQMCPKQVFVCFVIRCIYSQTKCSETSLFIKKCSTFINQQHIYICFNLHKQHKGMFLMLQNQQLGEQKNPKPNSELGPSFNVRSIHATCSAQFNLLQSSVETRVHSRERGSLNDLQITLM